MNKILILLLFISNIAIAQSVRIIDMQQVTESKDGEFFYPKFSPDGKKVLFTASDFKGLSFIDLKSGKITQISHKHGAGYEPVFSENGDYIFYRADQYEGLKRYSSIYCFDVKSNETRQVIGKHRHLSVPRIFGNQLVYTHENQLKHKRMEILPNSRSEELFVTIENQKIALYKNGKKSLLTPKGEGSYIWPELSPDKTKILFTLAGKGTYICNLQGDVIAEIGKLNAPKWFNNEWLIGMRDKDNGYYITESDVFMVSADGKQTEKVTNTTDKIEMYPVCYQSDNKVAFHTLKGDIFILTLKIK